jgi:isopentenyl diphosphate isomerase/L-lactate dehydrogenase-like FMN-dependent dehydrogenase
MAEFVSASKLPFVFKGILSEWDAEKALKAGAGALVVSHHNAIVHSAVPPLRALPGIAKLVNKKIPIFLDCGIIRGTDAFKALALGADAVAVGTPVMKALKEGNAEGVKKLLTDIAAELQYVMTLTGARNIADIDPDVIWE